MSQPPQGPWEQQGGGRGKKVHFVEIGAIVVIVVGVALLVSLTGDSDPQDVAEQAVAALNDKDVDAATSISCTPENTAGFIPPDLQKITLNVKLAGEVTESGDIASAPITVTATQLGRTQTAHGTIKLSKNNGNWCVEELF